MQGSGFRICGSGFRVQGLGFRALTSIAAQAWIVRLLQHLASFIIRTLRKGGDTFEVSDILKHLHDMDF